MSLYQLLITYAVCWWLVLFMVLPYRAEAPERPGKGHVPSAPANPRLRQKLAVTTLLALLPALLLYIFLNASDARAQSKGIYHAGPSDNECTDYVPPADLNAVDSNATLNPESGAILGQMDSVPVYLDIPVSEYNDNPAFEEELPLSGIGLGRMDVHKDGTTTLNGRPIGTSKTYGTGCK